MRALIVEEVNNYLEVFDLREKLITRLADFRRDALGRDPGAQMEVGAGETITVAERVYKRVLNTLQNGKTREGAISDGTLKLMKGVGRPGAGLILDGVRLPL
jgi:hypothetical protein